MARTKRNELTDDDIAQLRPKRGQSRTPYPDSDQRGLYWRASHDEIAPYATGREPAVMPGAKRKQVWVKIGRFPEIKAKEARERARAIIARIEAGQPAFEPEPVKAETVAEVCESWFQRHVVKGGLRTEKDIRYRIDKFLIPALGRYDFASIRRSHLTKLFDYIEDEHGAGTADHLLTDFVGLAQFYAGRHDNYTSPVIKGMRRDKSKGRERFLTDDEIRIIWRAAERPEAGAFGAIVRLGLLTLQRRAKLISMRWDHIVDGVWHIPKEPREKDNGGWLQLPPMALDIINARPGLGSSPFVFPAFRGSGHLVGVGMMKADFDKTLPAGAVQPWRIHDLRRTGRTLMAKAGVDREHAERVMGHAVGDGVEQRYDRHKYSEQKAAALAKLAVLIARIIDPPPADNVIELAARCSVMTA